MDEERGPRAEIRRRMVEDIAGEGLAPREAYEALFFGLESVVREVFLELTGDSLDVTFRPTSSSPSGDTLREFEAPTLERIAHYQLRRELGRGGQGVVYLAYDEKLKREVALKMLSGLSAMSEDARRRFEREATAASRLDHPAICTIYDSDVVHGIPYIAMQYVPGESLAARLAAVRNLGLGENRSFLFGFGESPSQSEATAVERTFVETGGTSGPESRHQIDGIVATIEVCARALHHAHSLGLIHRDVKPGNIMITTGGRPVLLDFGLAHVEGDDESLTLSGDVLGTPAYMSPEQVSGQREVIDGRTDIYSLGATLYEGLTLARPFQAPTREALYRAILSDPPPAPRKLNPRIPRDLEVILSTALEKDPRRRFDTAAEFADELRRYLDRQPIRTRPAGPMIRTLRWAQRHPSLAVALSALFLSLSVGLLVSLSFWQESEKERARVTLQRDAIDQQKREIERLADARIHEDLVRRESALWPPHPEHIPAMQQWIAEAEALVGRLDVHRAALVELGRSALPPSKEILAAGERTHEESIAQAERERDAVRQALRDLETDSGRADSLSTVRRAAAQNQNPALADQLLVLERKHDALSTKLAELEALVGARRAARVPPPARAFADDRLQWRNDRLDELILRIEDLAAPDDRGLSIASMKKRLALATTLRARSLEEPEERWEDVIDQIASAPGYEGFELTPQLGLVPLGRDPTTSVWEFAHVLSGEVPVRGSDGELVLNEDSGIVLSLILGGENQVGTIKDPDRNAAELIVRVALDPYFIGKYEVTQGQWVRVMGTNPSGYPAGVRPALLVEDPNVTLLHPVESVSFGEATEFCRRLGLRLPTESQWEVAARAGSSSRFFYGDDISVLEGRANVNGQENATGLGPSWIALAPWSDPWMIHAPVNATAKNGYGLIGMFGNVGEWCRDQYCLHRAFSKTRPRDGENVIESKERLRVYRGGTHQHPPIRSRVTQRNVIGEDQRAASIGLRVCRLVDN